MKSLTTVLFFTASVAYAEPANWNAPQQPFALYGNSYYVGTVGISAVLITSPQGHILIDGTGAKGAAVVAANIRSLGYRLRDVKYILNSHAHSDHAGGLAALQSLTGATVVAGRGNLATLASGKASRDDPQYGDLSSFAPVAKLRGVSDGELVKLGPLTVTAHATPGHTPGGVSWTWQSCVDRQCQNLAFGDSLSAASVDGYRFIDHPDIVASLRKGFTRYEAMPCDILVTAHPEANDVIERSQRQAKEGSAAFIDPNACREVAAGAREKLSKRLASEKK